jgi:hypothetical protein
VSLSTNPSAAAPDNSSDGAPLPELHALLRRLQETPAIFLAEPRQRKGKAAASGLHVGAIVSDLMVDLGGTRLSPDEIDAFVLPESRYNANLLTVTAITAHLLHDEFFRRTGGFAPAALQFLRDALKDLARLNEARVFVNDGERREELTRLALRALGLRPRGENSAQAQDRLTALDSVERRRVVEEARSAQIRAQQIREALARKEAEEAASKMMRE